MTGSKTNRLANNRHESQSDPPRRERSSGLDGLRFVETTYHDDERMPRHAHDVTKIGLLVAGGVEERAVRQDWMPPVCGLVIKPAGLDHADRFGPRGARMFSIQMKPALLCELVGDAPRAVESYRCIPCGPWTRPAFQLYRQYRESPRPVCKSRSESPATPPGENVPDQYHLESLLCDLLAYLADWPALTARQRPDAGWLSAVRDRIHDEFRVGVSVRAMADEAGVHAVHLARMFRRRHGCAVAEYVRRLRIQRAAALLTSTDLPIAGVADETGFADQPHLTRVFKAQTGLTPGAYRRLARG